MRVVPPPLYTHEAIAPVDVEENERRFYSCFVCPFVYIYMFVSPFLTFYLPSVAGCGCGREMISLHVQARNNMGYIDVQYKRVHLIYAEVSFSLLSHGRRPVLCTYTRIIRNVVRLHFLKCMHRQTSQWNMRRTDMMKVSLSLAQSTHCV